MATIKSTNVVWHNATVTRDRRQELLGHKSAVLWFTGLSGSGKSTLAHAVEDYLFKNKYHSFVLDGDNVRHGLCSDLGFSIEDRTENIRRIGEVAKLFTEAGIIVLTAFISPLQRDRETVRSLMPHGDFLEIYCACSLDVCEKRDVKGLYQKARSGEIKEFTGISSPYEPPSDPEIEVDTGALPVEGCVEQVIDLLVTRGIIPK
ncbi:MAG TPA: adenylyl-sulfate kinase [Gammaproteobacteria bacterium]|nr:adenylyl-sulfate kinase [Gammaproteobacteria bacterium]